MLLVFVYFVCYPVLRAAGHDKPVADRQHCEDEEHSDDGAEADD